MKFLSSYRVLVAALICAFSFGTKVAFAQPEITTALPSEWSFNVSPYLWIAGVKIVTSLDRVPPGTPPETTRFETKITGGALLEAHLNYRDAGMFVDFIWLRLNSESLSPKPAFSALNLESNIFHSTLAFSYRIPTSSDFNFTVFAGARFWSVKEDLTATNGILPGFSVNTEATWNSPAVGASVRYMMADKWSVVGRGFVNILNGDSDGWELMGGVSYRMSQSWTGTFAYRYLHEEFSSTRLNFKTDISGFVLGATYQF